LLPLEIRNVGNAPLTIATLQLDAAGSPRFTLPTPPALPLVIAPGDAVSVDIQFDPNANGLLRGALVIRGGTEGQVVNLVGTGTTTAAGMVAALFDLLGVADPPDVLV
jgi:protein involved in polysaccharide export with SLBB domain